MSSSVHALLDLCRRKNWRLSTAESCTSGLISAAITEVAGSSDVFDCGIAAYSHDAKRKLLGVPDALSIEYGAVSEQVVRAMLDGLMAASSADVGIAVTGVAGPGGTPSKPEGMVWFAFTSPELAPIAILQNFGALGRENVRKAAAEFAITHAAALHN